MSKARLVVTAVVVEGRSQGQAAPAYGVSQGWVSRLVARYRAEGEAAFEPRSRRPKTSPTAISANTAELIIRLRKQLSEQGLDAGPDTIAWHLRQHHQLAVSRATISRYLTAHGLVTPQPKKRPRSSSVRFQAALPNQPWQADFTHYRLADATDAEILTWLDDHSRYALQVSAWPRVTGPIVGDTFRAAVAAHGIPASTLTDNAMVFTTRLAGGKGGRNALEAELRRLPVAQKNAAPNHPTTCGKVERFQQTMKTGCAHSPTNPPPSPICRPCSTSSPRPTTTSGRTGPCPTAPPRSRLPRPPQGPPATSRDHDTHTRIRHDRIDPSGVVTLRVAGRLHHTGVGRTHARTQVRMLVDDLHVRIVNAATGELLQEPTIDPSRDYQPTGRPPGPQRKRP